MNGTFIFSTEPIIWFLSKLAMSAHFIWLAKKWPAIMVEWDRIEQMLTKATSTTDVNPVQKKRINVLNQINLITVFVAITMFS